MALTNTVQEGDELQKETIIAQELTSYSLIERFDNACCRLLANKPILAWLAPVYGGRLPGLFH